MANRKRGSKTASRASKTGPRRLKTTRKTNRATSAARSREGDRDLAPMRGANSPSPTAVAGEALRTGVVPGAAGSNGDPEIPGREGDAMRVGDPDVSPLANEYSGEEVPGSTTPTPDQNDVDEIGRAYGVEEEDTGALRTSGDLLDGRDRRRRSRND